MNTADHLREIVGQETKPPLWIYVTKDHIPMLERAAAELENANEAAKAAFVDGVLFGAFSMQGRHKEAAAVLRSRDKTSVIATERK